MSLLGQMIRTTNFRQFLDFASPSFFDVMPRKALWGEGKALLKGYRDAEAFRRATSFRRERVEGFGVKLVDAPAQGGQGIQHLKGDDRSEVGKRILKIYFHQLLDGTSPTVLDLSCRRFTWLDGQLYWHPGRGHKHWDETFRKNLAGVYLSFYTEEGSLEEALDPLGLSVATDLFKKHFGEGDQSAVTFRVDHFTSSFHQVFLRCRQHRVALHSNFLPLGIYLATLYDSLSTLGVPMDVRSAFESAHAATR